IQSALGSANAEIFQLKESLSQTREKIVLEQNIHLDKIQSLESQNFSEIRNLRSVITKLRNQIEEIQPKRSTRHKRLSVIITCSERAGDDFRRHTHFFEDGSASLVTGLTGSDRCVCSLPERRRQSA
ncbi:MAG: hypothetical protein ACPH9E_14305, partial [Hyphomonas sp.]